MVNLLFFGGNFNYIRKMIDDFTTTPEKIPSRISDSEVISMFTKGIINSSFIKYLKDFSDMNDDVLSNTLGVNVKTYRNLRNQKSKIRKDIQVQTVFLISLIKHGQEIFGTIKEFKKWLNTEIFQLGGKKPVVFLDTIPGIKFIDNRLTAIEYGDNV